MDIFQQQSMQNWKKQIIMDPHLNCLFDSSVNASQFVNTILRLPHPQIMKIYIKLTSLKHAISKNMQKEIQAKYPIIEASFEHNYETKNNYDSINNDTLKNNLKLVQKFNQKYELISEKAIQCKNLNTILHFAKALEKLKVNIRLLRSLMKDFDQNANSKVLDQLINSLKISKILKEISNLTLKFDFAGIRSFEEERAFINNTKGAIFGLVEKELTQILMQLPRKSHKREQNERQIVNKLMILTNINKLKDFRTTFYRNNLREMSQLCKKCLNIGQTDEEKDPKNHLLVFEEYFVNSLHKKMVEISIVFILFQEIIEKNSIKTGLNTNFFHKYWENLTEFIKGLLSWSIQNDPKEWARDKLSQSLYESFTTLESRNKINRYLTSAIWKYPIIYEQLASVSNEVHLFLIKNAKFHHYDFSIMKEKMIREVIPLCQLYYKHATTFYQTWIKRLQRYQVSLSSQSKQESNYPLAFINQALQDKPKSQESIQQSFKILDWLLFNIKAQEIYQFHVEYILKIVNTYFQLAQTVASNYDPNAHSKEGFALLVDKMKKLAIRFKSTLRRTSNTYSTVQYTPNLRKDDTKQVLLSTDKLIITIQAFRGFKSMISKWEGQFAL